MTFTDSELTQLARVLETSSDYVRYILTMRGDQVTAADKSAAMALVDSFITLDDEYEGERFVGNTANKGFESDVTRKLDRLRNQIAQMLGMEVYSGGAGGSSIALERG